MPRDHSFVFGNLYSNHKRLIMTTTSQMNCKFGVHGIRGTGGDRMFLGNLKIGTRLGLAFTVTLIMVLGIIALGVSRLESQDRLLSDFADDDVPGVATSLKWANSVLESARRYSNIFVLNAERI